MPEEFIRVGVAVVVKNGDEILLGKRLVKAGCGQWGLPGGHLEYGESIVAGAQRELLEETGLTVDSLEFLNITNDPRQDRHYIHLTFLAQGVHGNPQNLEPDKCESWEWFSVVDLPKPIFYGHAKLLEAVLENKIFKD